MNCSQILQHLGEKPSGGDWAEGGAASVSDPSSPIPPTCVLSLVTREDGEMKRKGKRWRRETKDTLKFITACMGSGTIHTGHPNAESLVKPKYGFLVRPCGILPLVVIEGCLVRV